MTAAYSPGWGTRVELGDGLERVRRQLQSSIRHPSRTWHDAPVMRGYGVSPSTAHRLVHRLAALGVVAIQTTLGSSGGTRFTFGVRFWRRSPVRRGMVARMMRRPDGQVTLRLLPEKETPPAEPTVEPPERAPIPQRERTRESFGEIMRRHGFRAWEAGNAE